MPFIFNTHIAQQPVILNNTRSLQEFLRNSPNHSPSRTDKAGNKRKGMAVGGDGTNKKDKKANKSQ